MFFEQYKENYFKLSDREAEIIDYLMKQDNLENITLKQISQDCFVSSSTVIRACKKLGYATYSDLRYSLQFSRQSKDEEAPKISSWQQTKNQLLSDLMLNLNGFKEEEFDTFSHLIAGARRVFCIGVGSSSMVASDFNRKLKLVNIWSNDYFDQYGIDRIQELSTRDDVIIVFSLDGKSQSVTETLLSAKQNQTKILSVTTFNSPLVPLSDHAICIHDSQASRERLRHRIHLNLVSVLIFECLLKYVD